MNHFFLEYSVITFATNKKKYLVFAFNCARSILLRNNINIYIVTNLTIPIPEDLKKNVFYIEIDEEHAKLGIGAKLYIDKYVQTKYSIFIDSDCLVYDSLQPLFNQFKGQSVSVVGFITEAENFCGEEQASNILNAFGISTLIRFNGGVYYIEKSKLSSNIFDFARGIIPNYDKLGFQKINGKTINEEGLLSISMIRHEQKPIPDIGLYMTDLYTNPYTSSLDVLTGFREIVNPEKGMQKHREWYPVGILNPIIIHFGGSSVYSFPYFSQHMILLMHSKGYSRLVIDFLKVLLSSLQKIKVWSITFLRKLQTNFLK